MIITMMVRYGKLLAPSMRAPVWVAGLIAEARSLGVREAVDAACALLQQRQGAAEEQLHAVIRQGTFEQYKHALQQVRHWCLLLPRVKFRLRQHAIGAWPPAHLRFNVTNSPRRGLSISRF